MRRAFGVGLLLSHVALATPRIETNEEIPVVVRGRTVGSIAVGASVVREGDTLHELGGMEVWAPYAHTRLFVRYCARPQQLADQPVYLGRGDELELLGLDGDRASVRAIVHPYDGYESNDRGSFSLSYDAEIYSGRLCTEPTRRAVRPALPKVCLKSRDVSLTDVPGGRVIFTMPANPGGCPGLVESQGGALRVAFGPGPALLGWVREQDRDPHAVNGFAAVDPGGDGGSHPALRADGHPPYRIAAGVEVVVLGVRVAKLTKDGIGRVLAREGDRVKVLVSVDPYAVVTGWVPATAIGAPLAEWRARSGLGR